MAFGFNLNGRIDVDPSPPLPGAAVPPRPAGLTERPHEYYNLPVPFRIGTCMEIPNKETLPILLVDDSRTDVTIVQKALAKAGILNPLHICQDGEEAIDFLNKRFSNVGILILDIHLPKVGGLEVLKEAKRIDPEMVVIMLTSHASMKTAIQSLRRDGAYDYLEKSKEDLPNLIEAV